MPYPVNWTDIAWGKFGGRSQSLGSRNGDVFFVIHHAVALTVDQIVSTFKSPNREVSASFAIGPRQAGVDQAFVVRTVPEESRPWTTASSIDDKALTVEVANLSLGGSYPVGQNIKQELAKIAAYMHTEYGMPLDRWHVTCHREVYQRGWGSYPTACPGDDLYTSLDWIVAEAIRIVNGSRPTPKPEDEMAIADLFTQFKKTGGQKIKKGAQPVHLHINDEGWISVVAGPHKHVTGNLRVQITAPADAAYKGSVQLTPVLNNVKDNKILSTESLGAREVIFTGGDTYAEITVNAAMKAGQKMAFKIGGSTVDVVVKSAIFRGVALD